ncbi:MAG: tRNA(Met) cytidine acetyltransferase [Colwellia sp.]|nr:tRNA(Met) cytidine acetyltransferase [Colwellia sp.]
MPNKKFAHWFLHFQQQTLTLNERRLVVLVGDNYWASTLLKSLDGINCCGAKHSRSTWLIYGDSQHIKANVAKQCFRDKLGSESDFVVFNDAELSIDAFAALSGTLVAGGVFFLLVNDLSLAKQQLFYQRFFSLLANFSEHVLIEQGIEQGIEKTQLLLPEIGPINRQDSLNSTKTSLAYGCKTQEQLNAVTAVIKVLKGKRNKPLVLTADRGRGKSSALAIACGQLLKDATKVYPLQLVITAADFGSLTIFFNQLAANLPDGELQQGKFIAKYGSVEFIAIDQLLKGKVSASLLLVDEAAAIPIYLLEQLLPRYSRLVFSSTIHGYEGAGRGFTLKFQDTLTAKFPQWLNLHMHQPIRWRADDPLERLVFDACLLNAELPNISADVQQIKPSQLLFKHFSAAELAANEQLLKQVFAVLVTAHYQTKPSDVQMLLDNQHVRLLCLLSKQPLAPQVVAVALLINEGKFNYNNIAAKDISAVNQSKRRLKNHFAPQSLLTQCGFEDAFNYHYLRVMRIAVHPQLQQQGIGSYFLNKITDFSTLQGADFLASSFGATKRLLSFWLQREFQLTRIGFRKDKASGEQSALVFKALSQTGQSALTDINAEFYRSFDYLLTDEYKYLAAELVALIQHHYPPSLLSTLSTRDKGNVEAFSQGHRQYSSCVFSLHLWLKHQLASYSTQQDENLLVLVSRIMQKHNISDVCRDYGFTGKKALEQHLKSTIKAQLST